MKISLRAKTALLILAIAAMYSAVGILVSGTFTQRLVDRSYNDKARDVANTMAAVTDARRAQRLKGRMMEIYSTTPDRVTSDAWGSPAFEEYIALYADLTETEDYRDLLQQLRMIQDVNDVDCLYLAVVDAPTASFVYLVDGSHEDPCPIGCIDPLYEQNQNLLRDPERGFPPYITNTEPYGWLVTAGTPVYNDAGGVVCYAMADISMDTLKSEEARFNRVMGLLLAGLTVLTSLVAIAIVNRAIIRPINQLSHAAESYDARRENVEIETLSIHTQDEIESLYVSIRQMMRDISSYIANLTSTTRELNRTRIQADRMNELANRDALTGVGSKLAYDAMVSRLTEEMQQSGAEYGILMVDMNNLKKLNDTYGHECGNDAIRRVCGIICEVFAHSPVYRIGGDEFVVVVKGRDYENIDALIAQFNAAMAAAGDEPWERVSAAVGFARYEGQDTVEDVFRAADQIMYQNKKAMRAGR